MPVIRFVAADALQTTTVENGIYPSQIVKIEGPKASGSGKSNSIYVDIQITEGKYKGKVKTVAFNDGIKDMFAPGSMQMEPQSKLLLVDSAISGRKVEAVDYQLDTDNLMNKPFDSQWVVATEEGQLHNHVTNFFPAGYGARQPSF